MIGKYAKGLRHLMNSVGDNEAMKVLAIGNRVEVMHVAKIKVKCDCEHLIIFQNRGGDRDICRKLEDTNGVANEMMKQYNYYYIVYDSNSLKSFGTRYLMLPKNFDTLYSNFLASNKKIISPIFSKYGGEHNPNVLYIFCNCNNSANLFAWAVTNMYKNNTSIFKIDSIFKWYDIYGNLSNKLLNGTITAYNTREKINSLEKELINIRREKRANNVINSFNTLQKKLLKGVELDENLLLTFSKFGRLSNTKQLNFIRKMSTIEDVNDIIKQMKLLVRIQYEWNKNSFMEFLSSNEDFKYNIVFDNENIVVLKVENYETIKHIAKTTNWCISKNMQYWNNYMKNGKKNKQYVMYDFSKKEDDEHSIVGFTVNNNCIIHAHSFTNISMMDGVNDNRFKTFSSVIDPNNIVSLLETNNVPFECLTDNECLSKYEWNRESFLKFLNYLLKEDDFDIIKDEDNKLVLFVKHELVRYLLSNKQYCENFDISHHGKLKHIIFCDFNKLPNDGKRLIFGFITKNKIKSEEICNDLYNFNCYRIHETIDDMLVEYGLPYETLCRVYKEETILKNKLLSFDLNKINEIISNKELFIKLLSNEEVNENFRSIIYSSLDCGKSFDLIDLIINNGYKFSELFNSYQASEFVKHSLYEVGNYDLSRCVIPNEEVFDKLINHKIKRNLISPYFYMFVAIKIMDNEVNRDFFMNIASSFCDYSMPPMMLNIIAEKITDKCDFSKLTDEEYEDVFPFVRYVCGNNFNNILSKWCEMDLPKNMISLILSTLSKTNPFFRSFQEKGGVEKIEDENEKVFQTVSYSFIDEL